MHPNTKCWSQIISYAYLSTLFKIAYIIYPVSQNLYEDFSYFMFYITHLSFSVHFVGNNLASKNLKKQKRSNLQNLIKDRRGMTLLFRKKREVMNILRTNKEARKRILEEKRRLRALLKLKRQEAKAARAARKAARNAARKLRQEKKDKRKQKLSRLHAALTNISGPTGDLQEELSQLELTNETDTFDSASNEILLPESVDSSKTSSNDIWSANAEHLMTNNRQTTGGGDSNTRLENTNNVTDTESFISTFHSSKLTKPLDGNKNARTSEFHEPGTFSVDIFQEVLIQPNGTVIAIDKPSEINQEEHKRKLFDTTTKLAPVTIGVTFKTSALVSNQKPLLSGMSPITDQAVSKAFGEAYFASLFEKLRLQIRNFKAKN